jgi:hypothetical protein
MISVSKRKADLVRDGRGLLSGEAGKQTTGMALFHHYRLGPIHEHCGLNGIGVKSTYDDALLFLDPMGMGSKNAVGIRVFDPDEPFHISF